MSKRNIFYTKTAAETTHDLEVDSSTGLTENQVQVRLKQYGPNKLPSGRKVSVIQLLLSQFKGKKILDAVHFCSTKCTEIAES